MSRLASILTPEEWAAAWATLSAQEVGRPREKFLAGCRAAMTESPEAFSYFERFALDAVAAKRTRFSADMIFNRIRWYTTVELGQGDFRLNDHYRTLFARLFAIIHPEHADLFEFRERNGAP